MGKSVWKIEEKRRNVAWSLAEKPRPGHLHIFLRQYVLVCWAVTWILTVDLTFAIAWCFLPLLKHNMCRRQAQRRGFTLSCPCCNMIDGGMPSVRLEFTPVERKVLINMRVLVRLFSVKQARDTEFVSFRSV
jgi:hypothetical protein